MAVGRYNFSFSIFIVILLRVLSFSVQRSQYELWNDPCIDFNHIIEKSHDFFAVNCLDFVVSFPPDIQQGYSMHGRGLQTNESGKYQYSKYNARVNHGW